MLIAFMVMLWMVFVTVAGDFMATKKVTAEKVSQRYVACNNQ